MSKKESEIKNQDELFTEDQVGTNSPPAEDFKRDLFASAIKWNPKNAGEDLIGIYNGIKTIDNPKAELEKDRQFDIGLIQSDSGEVYSVHGHALINKLLPMYPVGVKLRITYIGDIPTDNPSDMKNYMIDYATRDEAKIKAYRDELQGK